MVAARRLAAVVKAMRNSGDSISMQEMHHRELVQALIGMQCLWKPELLTNFTPATKRSGKNNAALFELLLATLVVYSGGHAGNYSAGLAGGSSGVSFSSSNSPTSECVHRLVCDLLVRSFDFSIVPIINDTLTAKNASLYMKVSVVMVVCRLPLQEALQFLPDAVALANKNIRGADYYMKQCLIESIAHALKGDSSRLISFHSEALKIVNKSYQDKIPEVRIAAASLLQVVAERTSISLNPGASGAGGGQEGGGSNASQCGSGSNGSATGPSTVGSSANVFGVSLDAILHISAKGMDDANPEARRAYSVVVGVVLAKFATTSSGETELQAGYDNNGRSASLSKSNDEENSGRASMDQEAPTSNGAGKSKSGFKLHVPAINLPSSLSRKKVATVNFSTIPNVIVYFKDMVASKYLSMNPSQSHGEILASFSIALCNMFDRLPPDLVAESQLREIMDATIAILDHPFALGDLTRARNAVGYVLRYGLNACLIEQQQEVLLRAYLQKVKSEAKAAGSNHHKIITILVELSYMFHSMGEASITQASVAIDILQGLTCHEKQSIRFQTAVALASLVTAMPYRLKKVLTSCLQGLRDTAGYLMRGGPELEELENVESAGMTADGRDESNDMSKSHLYAIQGGSAAIVHILRAVKLDAKGGLSQTIMDAIYAISEELVESQFLNECADSIWLTCTRAGWTLVGSLVSMNDEQWVTANLEKLLNLWLKSSVLHSRESSLELLRIEAAVIALSIFLTNCQNAVKDSNSDEFVLASHVLHVYLMASQDALSNPLKRRGQIARYRLMGCIVHCFAMLPPVFSDSYIVLLDLIAEFTTAHALTNLRHSTLVPAKSTYLKSVLSSEDKTLDMVTLSRISAGDNPAPLLSRDLNHILGLQQRENALTDTELEVQYLDTFRISAARSKDVDFVTKLPSCSPFTYVRLVDTSVVLFGRLFHFLPEDLQLRCLQQYAGALSDVRTDCEVNVCSLLFAVIVEARHLNSSGALSTSAPSLSATSWLLQMQTMLCELISSNNADVRRGAGEALGTLALLLGEDHCKGLIVELEKRLLMDKPPQGTSAATFGSMNDFNLSILSAGAAFALACIKRVCGSRVSFDTGLILRLAGEYSQPLRTWILHSWGIILQSVDSTGGDYEHFVSSTISLLEAQIMAGFVYSKMNKHGMRWNIGTKVATGRIINNMVAALGPELDGSSARLSQLFSYWAFLRQDGDTRLELEYLRFLEQVVVFAPSRFQAADLRYILRIVSDTALLNSADISLQTAQQLAGSANLPPSGSNTVMDMNTEPFERIGLVNVGAISFAGMSRSILQNVGLSCIRTLVERDPTLIRRQNLFCLLLTALHVEYNALAWTYLPKLHGMWDALSLPFADFTTIQRNSIDTLQSTALALLDVEGRDHESAEPCIWALLCRGIAIGESASSSANPEDFKTNLKAINLDILATTSIDDDNSSKLSNHALKNVSQVDANLLSSAAIATQVHTWRATKAKVGELLALVPPLSRQVRQFSVECVLRVFELMAVTPPMAIGVSQINQLHFDLAAVRRFFAGKLSAGVAVPISPNCIIGNFLCMYLDEFVTLACQIATTSAEGKELLMFQCLGLRLINVLIKKFASARDPEVTTGDAYLLDPYRAQLSSAIRHAFKQVHVEQLPLSATIEREIGEEKHFYAPLLLEAHGIAGACISAHITQDRVALGRILRAVKTSDYGHAHFIGDELTRISLSLANLASVGELLTSSITKAIDQNDIDDDEHQAVASSPFVKAMTSELSESIEYLLNCWIDSTFAYSVAMQEYAHYAHLETTNDASLIIDKAILLPALQMPLPLYSAAKTSATATSTFKDLCALYKRYWPKIVNAMAIFMVFLSNSILKSDPQEGTISKWTTILLSSAIFHIRANTRDRMEAEDELRAVLRSVPLLLRAFVENASTEALSTNFPMLFTVSLNTLKLASKRCCGLAQVVALETIFECLSRKNLDIIQDVCRAEPNKSQYLKIVNDAIVQAGICPIEVMCLLCDARSVSVGNRSTTNCQSSVASVEITNQMTKVVQLATTGIILLHSTKEARHGVVHSIALVQQVICSIASQHHPSLIKDAVAALSRASIESVLALARTKETEENSTNEFARIKFSVRQSLGFLAKWLKVDIRSAPKFSMQIVANYALPFPASLQIDAERFHNEINVILGTVLKAPTISGSESEKQQYASTRVEMLQGTHAVVRKLVDTRQQSILNRYLVALGPALVEIVCATNGYPKTPVESNELYEAGELIRVLTKQLSSHHSAKFVSMLLPRLATVISHPTVPAVNSVVSDQVSSILARLLLWFAQTHAVAFKEAVNSMSAVLRGVLESSLRIALAEKITNGAPVQSFFSQGKHPAAAKLDLSRYN
ncbi:uncharacterized protein CCR75_005102 [Bremia lactucae]|uniref:Uncharacterized protein n=1 Tax=Bremia lactucae TaxID=4779 RepID=A0A976FPH8_BRELC|nr:hypothetical protein CCR75_005102 [Bremia lactucae]